jgi:hypothetical protein
MINLAIIDADSICYLGGKIDSLQQILEKVDYKIQEILDETKADYYVLLISKGKYFRHDISKSKDAPEGSYKSNRSYLTQPWVRTIKEYLIVKYKAVWYPQLEADDIAAWLMNKNLYLNKSGVDTEHTFEKIDHYIPDSPYVKSSEEVNKILVAKDKDLLYSIPGNHLNFSKKLDKDTWGMEWVETSINDASFYEWEAMVTGDQSDGVKGLYRKGKVWVDKNFAGKSLKEVQHLVFQEYMSEYGTEKGIYEFQKNFRLLHMLNSDEDMLREVGYIPELPEFQKVVKEEIITNNVNKIEF